MWSELPLAKVWLSGLKATDQTKESCPSRRVGGAVGSVTCQRRIVLSELPLARVWPSGLKATDQTLQSCPRRIEGGGTLGLVKSQRRMVLSELPLARVWPLGLKATDQTFKSCPWRMEGGVLGLVKSQRWMVVSELALARVCPSGLKATDQTLASCPWRMEGGVLGSVKSQRRRMAAQPPGHPTLPRGYSHEPTHPTSEGSPPIGPPKLITIVAVAPTLIKKSDIAWFLLIWIHTRWSIIVTLCDFVCVALRVVTLAWP